MKLTTARPFARCLRGTGAALAVVIGLGLATSVTCYAYVYLSRPGSAESLIYLGIDGVGFLESSGQEGP